MNTVLAIVLAIVISFLIAFLLGFVLIPWLRKLHFGQTILEIGPAWHKSKQGTPTVGGLIFIIPTSNNNAALTLSIEPPILPEFSLTRLDTDIKPATKVSRTAIAANPLTKFSTDIPETIFKHAAIRISDPDKANNDKEAFPKSPKFCILPIASAKPVRTSVSTLKAPTEDHKFF